MKNNLTRALTRASGVHFKIDPSLVAKYGQVQPPFGFNGLGEVVYRRTYSRLKEDGTNEKWHETIERVVNGTFSLQKRWSLFHEGVEKQDGKFGKTRLVQRMPWHEDDAQIRAADMFDRMWQMKFLPPGRGLWAMGSSITEERGLFSALNNCAFVSTKDLLDAGNDARDKPFCFLMDSSMLGIGVGFDTRGAGAPVAGIDRTKKARKFIIEDSREGWVASLSALLRSHFYHLEGVDFDYSLIREAGLPIKGFGGISSGPKILEEMLTKINDVLEHHRGACLDVRSIVDIMNLIGCCVVSGNVRRSAEISFGDANDVTYLNLKNYAVFPERAEYGWASNNSVFATLGQDYSSVARHIMSNGEPGVCWLENMQKYGRMNGKDEEYRDRLAMGGNPCMEQTLENYEMCCLVETFPTKHLLSPTNDNNNSNHHSDDEYLGSYRSMSKEDAANKRKELDALRKADMVRYNTRNNGTNSPSSVYRDGEHDDLGRASVNNNNNINSSSLAKEDVEFADFKQTLRAAFEYAKTVSLTPPHWKETADIVEKNRRIGCSMSGLAQYLAHQHGGIARLRRWCDEGYEEIEKIDRDLSNNVFGVRESIKKTSIKPSGTVSLLAGATAGMHFPESRFFIRRVRFSSLSPLVPILVDAGYSTEKAETDDRTTIVSFPIDSGRGIKTINNVSVFDQLNFAAFLQKYWADNQVSCTVTFSESEAAYVSSALSFYQFQLKSISFLPKLPQGAFKQMPLEEISEEEYQRLVSKLKPMDFDKLSTPISPDTEDDKYCEGGKCQIPSRLTTEQDEPEDDTTGNIRVN